MYIDPSAQIDWHRAHRAPAPPPGFHASQADSSMGAVLGALSAEAAEALLDESRSERVNGARDDEPKYLPRARASYLASLITGQWGPPQRGRRYYLNVVDNPSRAAPGAKWREAPFFARMDELARALSDDLRRVEDLYDKRGRTGDWLPALRAIHRDVEWVRGMRGRALAGTARIAELRAPRQGSRRRKRDSLDTVMGLDPERLWPVIAARGNTKLPFGAYSEAPMATCPGAGRCASYCYSFHSWRNVWSFARQARSTLAAAADREFAIMAGMASAGRVDELPPSALGPRARWALSPAGREARLWPQVVKGEILGLLAGKLERGEEAHLRLFVDGDIGYEDSIVAWMEMCRDISRVGRDTERFIVWDGRGREVSRGSVNVYGYTKCWQQFVNVDKLPGFSWPPNYVVNMSKDSVYADAVAEDERRVVRAMEELPITRGYFIGVPMGEYIEELERVYDPATGTPRPFTLPDPAETPFPFSARRIRQFTELYRNLLAAKDAPAVYAQGRKAARRWRFKLYLPEGEGGSAGTARRNVLRSWLAAQLAEAEFAGFVRRDLEADGREPGEVPSVEAVARSVTGAGAYERKVLALVLHEVLWSYGIGGSCPLVCGNCSDALPGVTAASAARSGGDPPRHRCSSVGAFWKRDIHIGIH